MHLTFPINTLAYYENSYITDRKYYSISPRAPITFMKFVNNMDKSAVNFCYQVAQGNANNSTTT
jgi:hypothetical protein